MGDYTEIKAVNQSSLKKILTHPNLYLQAKKKQEEGEQSEAAHFVFGSAVDIMLVGSKDEFDKKFVKIPDETKCSDTIKGIIKEVYNDIAMSDTVDDSLDNYKLKVLEYANYANYQSNWKDDTRVDKIVKEGNEYFELLKTLKNKTPITESEYAKAVLCVMALKSNEFTQKYCKKEAGIDFLDRFIVEFNLKETKMKGELDRVVINHNTKTITPLDFKTTSQPIYAFNSEFWKYRYDIQAATYTIGLKYHSDISDLIKRGYKLENFKYIVVEKELNNTPVVFNILPEVIFVGLEGGERKPWKIEGLFQAIERLQFAENENKWNFPMEYYEKGEIDIEL